MVLVSGSGWRSPESGSCCATVGCPALSDFPNSATWLRSAAGQSAAEVPFNVKMQLSVK